MTLEFDAAKHEYRLDGVRLPSVTQIIAPLVDLSHIPPATLEHARQEGVAIHRMAELHFTGQLDLAGLYGEPDQAWLIPHYEALLKFTDETGAECWATEKRLVHRGLGFAGTADFFGVLPKLSKIKGAVNIDIKRSLYGGAAIGLQTAGYTRAWNDNEGRDRQFRVQDSNRFALQLRKDGTYRLTQFEKGDDFTAFLALLTMHRWRETHGRT